MTFWDDKRISVTGGAGFLGSFVAKKLREKGVGEENIRIPRSKETDSSFLQERGEGIGPRLSVK